MTPPIIIIGMHRSGTSMITQLLQQLGLHVGWLLQEDQEALFFLERNEKLMNVCGGSWEQPQVVEGLLNHAGMRKQVKAQLARDIESLRFLSYLGPKHWSCCGKLDKLDFSWGWKDPRNTFWLPLWLDLFPKAKVIHVYRHPMDVAMSLSVRERHSVEMQVARLSGAPVANGHSNGKSGIRARGSQLLWLYNKYKGAHGRLAPLRQYEKRNVPSCLSLTNGFRLWSQYVEKCFEHQFQLNNEFLHLKYEDFLVEPKKHLGSLKTFCGLRAGDEQVDVLTRAVQVERRYAFKTNKDACQIFEQVRSEPLVRKLGYDCV